MGRPRLLTTEFTSARIEAFSFSKPRVSGILGPPLGGCPTVTRTSRDQIAKPRMRSGKSSPDGPIPTSLLACRGVRSTRAGRKAPGGAVASALTQRHRSS